MDERSLNVLLVASSEEDTRKLKELLAEAEPGAFRVASVERLAEAKGVLDKERADLILLDLSLPDRAGIEDFAELHAICTQTPIIVLSGPDNVALAAKAVQMGAQDYLTKGKLEAQLLAKSIHYAIERQRLLSELETMRRREQGESQALSLLDELTGLYSRQGFCNVAEHQLKLAVRDGVGVYLLYADVDNFRGKNETFGRLEGDGLLQACARTLKRCFRASDVLGRMGADEFAVLAIHVDANRLDSLLRRLSRAIEAENQSRKGHPLITLSVGAAHYDPLQPCGLDELLAHADEHMNAERRAKQG